MAPSVDLNALGTGFEANPDGSPNLQAYRPILDAIPNLAVILNAERQAIFINQALRTRLGPDRMDLLLGHRPGVLLNCIHWQDAKGGCGEGEACQLCGANQTIRQALASRKPASGECRITINEAGQESSLDLRVTAHPFTLREKTYAIVSIQDISDHKRRLALERIFLHDLINTAGGLKGLLDLLAQLEDPEELRNLARDISHLSEQLFDEIQSQKSLSLAENGELMVIRSPFSLSAMLKKAVDLLGHHPISQLRHVRIEAEYPEPDPQPDSDQSLALRIVVNMVKNALEASPANAVVRIDTRVGKGGAILIRVHNEGVIPHEAQLQLFQRSFSTKGANRGLGTYSMKLLAERYLGGRVGFESRPEMGTVFWLELPMA